MSAPDVFDLDRLIHPVATSVFLAEHWDRRPLLVQGRGARYFDALFSFDDVDRLLASYGSPGEHDLRLVKRGGSPSTILLPAGQFPSVASIHAAYRDGYTVNVNDMAPRHPALRRMTNAVLGQLGIRPRPNLFLTPPGSRAFDLHFETHDVMIVQIGGKKEWKVYDRVEENPCHGLSDGSSVPRDAVGAPIVDTVLEAGDVLYVPRGFVHEAYTAEELSLHITLGLSMGTYLDLLPWLAQAAGPRSPSLRASIPPGALLGRSRAELKETMIALLRSELGESVIDDAMSAWAGFELSRMPPVHESAFSLHAGGGSQEPEPELSLDEPLHKAPGLVASVAAGAGRARIHFQGGVVEGPWKLKAALEHVAEHHTIRARELPGALGDAEKLVLARRLVREGVLTRSGR